MLFYCVLVFVSLCHLQLVEYRKFRVETKKHIIFDVISVYFAHVSRALLHASPRLDGPALRPGGPDTHPTAELCGRGLGRGRGPTSLVGMQKQVVSS